MKPVAERRKPQRYKGQPRGPRPDGWVNPVKGMNLRRGRTTAERFFALVAKGGPGECWIWTGAKRPYGYGNFWLDGGNAQAHRVSLELVGRKPEPDDAVDHLCKNPACVNPEHLRIVTHTQNSLENNESPFAKNSRKTHCLKGHPFTDDNMAVRTCRPPKGKLLYRQMYTRICLTCQPYSWRYAVVKRDPPPNARPPFEWIGPPDGWRVFEERKT